MGWERRRNGMYFYRKVREGNRVRSVYEYGTSGELAEVLPRLDKLYALDREEEKLFQRERVQSEEEQWKELFRLERRARDEARAAVLALAPLHGIHCHRGSWRKPRMSTTDENAVTLPANEQFTTEEVKAVQRMIAAHKEKKPPKDADRELYRAALERLGTGAGYEMTAQGLARTMACRLIGNSIAEEATSVGLEEVRQSLGIEMATPLERMLIEHVATAWAVFHAVETQYALATREQEKARSIDTRYQIHLERRYELAQRRYLRALESLAKVRRLALPVMQVNVGQNQQINNANAVVVNRTPTEDDRSGETETCSTTPKRKLLGDGRQRRATAPTPTAADGR